MNNLQTFNFNGNQIRTLEFDGVPYFVGKDVAEVLGYKDTAGAIKDHIDEEDKRLFKVGEMPTLKTSNYGVFCINESGLYSLILSSKLPKAKEFKRWVTSEVLPAIRKTGKYEVAPKPTRTTERTAEVMLNWAKTVIKELVDKEDYKAKYEIFAYCAEAAGLTDFPIPNCAAELLYKEDIPLSVRNILIRLDSTVKNENMSYNYLYKDIVAQYGSSRKIKKNSFWKIVLQWATSKGYTVRQFRSNGDKRITFVDSNGYVVLGAEENGVTIC